MLFPYLHKVCVCQDEDGLFRLTSWTVQNSSYLPLPTSLHVPEISSGITEKTEIKLHATV
jgi:hypothetical protein